MGRRKEDVLLGSALGLMVGALPGLFAAGAFVTWRLGGDLGEIGLGTFPALLPDLAALGDWPFKSGALVGLGTAAASALAGVALLWREELTSHGTARWAEPRELRRAELLARRAREIRGPVWGKLGRPRSLAAYLSSERIVHSLIAAPTGAGKGVGVVIPTLLTYLGSIVGLDIKGENYAKTARRRRQLGDRVFRFAPYAKDRRSHRYNPFDEVAAAPERRRFAEALRLAGSLIEAKGKGTESWVDGAREIFAATAVVARERGTPTIAAVYDLLTQAGAATDLLAALAAATKSGEARSVFNRFASQPEKVLGSYMSVMFDGGLRLWADPDVRDATAASDFEITSFRSDPGSVFICVSQKDLGVLSPLIRLMFQQMFTALQETERGENDKFDVLFLLDEFASLGKMEEMSRAITTVRSSGAHLMLIVQSLANLKETYGAEGAANFMGNCELQLFMAPTDMDTPRYISEAIGDATRRARVKSWRQRGWDAATIQERNEGARLIRPEQIRLLGPETAVALIRDQNPVRLHKVRYYEDRALKALFAGQQSEAMNEPPEMEATPLPGEALAVDEVPDAGREPPPTAASVIPTPVPPSPPTPAGATSPEVPSAEGGDAETGEAATHRKLDRLVSDQRGIASEMASLISQARANLRSNHSPEE
ncbi:type IV secretory system conjugative DNA transfer family protein [Amaricoccus solimangrovi]|uniref:Type IV secretion system protein VirD4 n=1 Tax=Amaricoccus solimangrovi TaxID=2589815 RepID=A0A501WIF9_9RHOB|nr:type IV secretory system conjugative DNA transfer family protein [Amaricoccus solimangrovi]TPE47894.1 type IV secretion system protein VirD4 [Amaricoccus solimangrovi]